MAQAWSNPGQSPEGRALLFQIPELQTHHWLSGSLVQLASPGCEEEKVVGRDTEPSTFPPCVNK